MTKSKPKLYLKIPGVSHLRAEPYRTFCYIPETQRFVCSLEKCSSLLILDLRAKTERRLDLGSWSPTTLCCAGNLLIVALEKRKEKLTQIKVYDLSTVKCLVEHSEDNKGAISHLVYDPDTRVVLTGSDQSINFIEIDKGLCLRSIPNPATLDISRLCWNTKTKTIDAHWCIPTYEWKFRLIRY